MINNSRYSVRNIERKHSWGLLGFLTRDQIDTLGSYPYDYFRTAYYYKPDRNYLRCHMINYDSVVRRMNLLKQGVARHQII